MREVTLVRVRIEHLDQNKNLLQIAGTDPASYILETGGTLQQTTVPAQAKSFTDQPDADIFVRAHSEALTW